MERQITHRYSKQRECILKTLQDTVSHPTANWVYDRVRLEIPNISLGTVYRNLSQLCDDRVIIKIDVGDGTERYDAITKPHYHLYCRECGCVCDIEARYADELDKITEQENKCVIDYHNLVFCGVCAKCTAKL